MRTIPWRVLIVFSLAFACLCAAHPGPAAAQAVRKSITALTPAELMSLRRGMATMIARNGAPRNSAEFRRSAIYWANLHGHFGDDCAGPITGSGMAGVQTWSASNASERATWCTCEHHTDQFLTWHRMYLHYFQQVLRQASGNPALTLPYWDYAADGRLPPALRDRTYTDQSGQTVANPLWVAARRPQINAGTAGISTTSASSANAMAATTRASFSSRLESAPHGTVHCAVASGGCPTRLMGKVAVAALDPVFFLHHSNIDRLYEFWLKVDQTGRLPTSSAVLDRQYSFIDGSGTLRTRRVRDMLTTTALNYTYTAGAGCPAAAPPPTAVAPATVVQATQATPEARMAPTLPAGGFEIGKGTTEVPVEIEGSGAALQPSAAQRPVASAVVTVEGLAAYAPPGVLFNVYLADANGRRAQIGVIDFFAFDEGGGGRHAAHGAGGRTVEFDATGAVRALGLGSSGKPRLLFEATTGLSDSTPALAAEAFAPDAQVSFRRARLRVDR